MSLFWDGSDDFVVMSSPRKLRRTMVEGAVFTAIMLGIALVSRNVVVWIAALTWVGIMVLVASRRPWRPSACLTVTDAGIRIRRGPAIPWADIENIALDGTELKIWLRPSARYFKRLVALPDRILKHLATGVPTLRLSGEAVDVPLDLARTEIATRSGEPWKANVA